MEPAMPPTAPSTVTPSSTKSGFLINGNFALLFSGSAISSIGDFVFSTTLVLWIAVILAKGQSWAPLAVSGVLIATTVPAFLIGPFAGVFVDRWDKRRTMLAVNLIQAIVVALLLPVTGIIPSLPFLPGGTIPTPWAIGLIYAVVFLVNAANQFSDPASTALIGDIVDEPERARAMGFLQGMFALSVIVGPPVAAPLLFAFGVQWALLLNALSFVGAFAAIWLIRAPKAAVSVARGERGHFFREFIQGARFFFGSRILVTIAIAGGLTTLGAGALNALDVFFVTGKEYLGQSPSLYGFVGAVSGAGILVGSVLGGLYAQRIGLTRVLWFSLFLCGVGIVIFSRMTVLPPALLLLLLIGILSAQVDIAIGPLMLNATPRELIGRVQSVLVPLLRLASFLSIAVAGYLDSTLLRNFAASLLGIRFHAVDTIFLLAGVLIALGGIYALTALRGAGGTKQPSAVASPPLPVEAMRVTSPGANSSPTGHGNQGSGP
jgi:MFS family permease